MYVHAYDTWNMGTAHKDDRNQSVVHQFLTLIHSTLHRWMNATQEANRALREGSAFNQLSEDLKGFPDIVEVIPEEHIAPMGELHVVIVTTSPPGDKTQFLVRHAVATISGRHGLRVKVRYRDRSK